MSLNRSSSSRKDMHVVWDEDNLQQNAQIQQEFSGVKIQEPKTPYRPPLPSDSLSDEMRPLQLDEGALLTCACCSSTPHAASPCLLL